MSDSPRISQAQKALFNDAIAWPCAQRTTRTFVVREGEPQLQHFLFTLHKSQRLTLPMPEVLVSPLKDGQLILNSVFINQET